MEATEQQMERRRLLPFLLQARGTDVGSRDDPAFYYPYARPPQTSTSARGAESADPNDEWVMVTWAAYARAVSQAARALLALRPPEAMAPMRVALFAKASYEYMVLHMACLTAGVVPVALPLGSSAAQLRAVLAHAHVRHVFVDSEPSRLRKLADQETLAHLDSIFVFPGLHDNTDPEQQDDKGSEDEELKHAREAKSASWRDFLRLAGQVTQETLNEQMKQLRSDQLASVVYTSTFSHATHGPRGMMYSHHNLLWTAERCAEAMQLDTTDIHFSCLPMAHITEQLLSIYCPLVVGHRVFVNGERRKTLMQDIRNVQPTRLVTPASFWKALHSWLHEQLAREVTLPSAVLRMAPEGGVNADDDDSEDDDDDDDDDSKSGGGKEKRERPVGENRAPSVKQKLSLKDVGKNPLLLHIFKQRMGLLRLRVGYSSFVPLPAKIVAAFGKLDLNVCELYAHPYTTGLVACNRPLATVGNNKKADDGDDEDDEKEDEETNKPGTVGIILADSQIELDEDSVPQEEESNHGEILIKGPHVFMGFLNDDNATTEVFAREGWVRTGDVGTLDEDEFVKLKGRRDDLFRLQTGQLVLPWKIEKLLKTMPIIEDALVLGDGRGHVAALLALSTLSRALSSSDRMTAIKEAVITANGKLDEVMLIKKIATISPSTKLAHNPRCTTPFGRVIRTALVDCFPKEVSALYPDDERLAQLAAANEEAERERAKVSRLVSSGDDSETDDSAEEDDDEEHSESESEESEESSRSAASSDDDEPRRQDEKEEDEEEEEDEDEDEKKTYISDDIETIVERTKPLSARNSDDRDEARISGGSGDAGDSATEPVSVSATSVLQLTEGIMVYLFSFLDPSDLRPVALACRRFKSTLDDEVLWKLLLQRTYGVGGLLVSQYLPVHCPGVAETSGGASGVKAVDWRNTFINRAKIWKAHQTEEPVERLALCAKWGAVPLLQQLLRGRDDAWVRDVLNQKTRIGGKTVLHWACEHGNVRFAEYLVTRYGPWLDLNIKADIASVTLWPKPASAATSGTSTLYNNNNERAPHVALSLASESGHLDLVRLLLEQGDVRCDLAMTLQCLIAAVEKEREVVVQYFLDRLHKLLLLPPRGETATNVKSELSAEEVGEATAAAAAMRGAWGAEQVEEVVFRAKIWALELACERGNARIVRDLIASGGIHLDLAIPDTARQEEDGEEDGEEEDQERQLMMASTERRLATTRQHYYDEVVKRFHGLFRACEKGSVKIVTALLDCGLHVNMRELPRLGGDGTSSSQQQEEDAWTALHYAAKRGDLALVQKLVARGADPSLTARFDSGRATPLEVAEAMDRDEGGRVVAYLRLVTPRVPFHHRPEVVLSAAGSFVLVAVAYLLIQLGSLFS